MRSSGYRCRNLRIVPLSEMEGDLVCKSRAGAKELANGYTAGKRRLEYFSLFTSAVFNSYVVYVLVKYFEFQDSPWILFSIFLGMLLADFLSGLAHWSADSYGSVDLPFIGKAFIRPFREHHVNPLSITHHDFVETNADNCLMPLFPLIAICYIMYHQSPQEIRDWYRIYSFLFALQIMIIFTNQFHKWSHVKNPPKLVVWLQKCRIILPKKHHMVHHIAPHEMHFCPTTGWCNYPLEMIGFWTKLEGLIERLTGVRPRTDDMQWAHKK